MLKRDCEPELVLGTGFDFNPHLSLSRSLSRSAMGRLKFSQA